jgi:hypothetical protein
MTVTNTYLKRGETPHALIRFEAGGANAEILAVGSEADMLTQHAEQAEYGVGRFYSVRQADNDLTRLAARTMAEKLGRNQRRGLGDLEADRQTYGRHSVRPGYEGRGPRPWKGMYSTDLNEALRAQSMHRFVRVSGVPYGPKTFTLTRLGRLIGKAELAIRAEQAGHEGEDERHLNEPAAWW